MSLEIGESPKLENCIRVHFDENELRTKKWP